MAEKSSGKTTKLITSLLKRNISSFNEVLDENPVLAFHNEKKVRRFIEIFENNEKRARRWTGFREIRAN